LTNPEPSAIHPALVNQAEVGMSRVGASASAVAVTATAAAASATVVKLASASTLPASRRTRRGWRTSRLRSVPWLYSPATEMANRARATTPMNVAPLVRVRASPSAAAS
jgi:hypothetical protein